MSNEYKETVDGWSKINPAYFQMHSSPLHGSVFQKDKNTFTNMGAKSVRSWCINHLYVFLCVLFFYLVLYSSEMWKLCFTKTQKVIVIWAAPSGMSTTFWCGLQGWQLSGLRYNVEILPDQIAINIQSLPLLNTVNNPPLVDRSAGLYIP